MDKNILKSSFIFAGLDDAELSEALVYLGAREVCCRRGSVLIAQGESITGFGIIMSGTVQVSSYDINGNRMIMATVGTGETFAESLAVTGVSESPVFAEAMEDTCLVWLSAAPIRRNIADSALHAKIVSNFTIAVAHKCLDMNNRIQILSKKTIREKVITLLSQLSEKEKRQEFTLSMDRQAMANYLGVERSALSRELSKMAAEGIISYRKNCFRIL